jgi:hypothetical protein
MSLVAIRKGELARKGPFLSGWFDHAARNQGCHDQRAAEA